VVTIGQYLAPSSSHAPVARYYPPEEFEMLAETARSLGFLGVASGPFVRSSYNAGDVYERYRRMRPAHTSLGS
jgi:lipoic acid synthetase